MAKDIYDDKSKRNIKALTAYMLAGTAIVIGQVVPKSDFKNKTDWQNLVNMEPQRCEETDEAVGVPKAPQGSNLDNSGVVTSAEDKDPSDMNVAELKAELKGLELPTNGNRAALLLRLTDALEDDGSTGGMPGLT